MKLVLRPYQVECVDALFGFFKANKTGNPILALPTGTGKSVVLGELVKRIMRYPGQRVMMLTHVKELVQQNYDKLLTLWPTAPVGIYSAGLDRREVMPITFAGIGSVYKKGYLFGKVDLVFIDECHLVSPAGKSMYQKLIGRLKENNPKLRVIGLSATPYRIGKYKGHLVENDNIFTDVAFDITGIDAFNQLIDDGYLSLLIPKQTGTSIDTSKVTLRGGEFVESQLQGTVDTDKITNGVVRETLSYGSARKHWLVFATGINHAEHLAGAFRKAGIEARAVHSKIDAALRDQYIADFQAGKIRALVNNNVLTTGFDFPDIDLICMVRPTNSPGLWVQMLGRGTRPAPGKTDCLVLDFAGNTMRLGPVNDPAIPAKRSGAPGPAPCKVCPDCDAIVPAGVRVCPHCKHEFPAPVTKLEAEASTLGLVAGRTPSVRVEDHHVDRVDYELHVSYRTSMACLKVIYHCDPFVFFDFITIGYDGWAGDKAREWWEEHSDYECPESVESALAIAETLKKPHSITVVYQGKHPRVEDRAFTDHPDYAGRLIG